MVDRETFWIWLERAFLRNMLRQYWMSWGMDRPVPDVQVYLRSFASSAVAGMICFLSCGSTATEATTDRTVC